MAQSEMNRRADEDGSAADAELNRVYEALLAKNKGGPKCNQEIA
jgi:uncharacterized protein YecT (DUF1311 family)